MTAHVTKRFAYFLADQIFESVSETSPSRLYTFVARPAPYANDSVTATPRDDTQNNDYNIFKQMLAAKKVSTTDITYAIKRYNWANNNLYAFHICDWLNPTVDMLNDRGLMGDGVIDVKKIRSWVEQAGFDGYNEVEIFSTRHWAEDQNEFFEKIKHAYLNYS